MARWFILIGTFVIWLACMALIIIKFGPHESHREDVPGIETNLDSIFSENTEVQQHWSIFADLQRLKNSNVIPFSGVPGATNEKLPPLSPLSQGEDGDEMKLQRVGDLHLNMTRHTTRLEQNTRLKIALPPEANMPLLQLMGELRYESRADISLDEGLENFSSTFTAGIGLKASSIGTRDGRDLNVTQQVSQNGKELYLHHDRFPIGLKSAPNLSLMPFEQKSGIREGDSWNIAMLDTSINPGEQAQPRIVSMKATCTGRSWIMYGGTKINVYDVECKNGTARAWYSVDGVVLKQRYRFIGALDLMLVREAAEAK